MAQSVLPADLSPYRPQPNEPTKPAKLLPPAQAKEYGIRNILALRGDPPKGQDHFEQVGHQCRL